MDNWSKSVPKGLCVNNFRNKIGLVRYTIPKNKSCMSLSFQYEQWWNNDLLLIHEESEKIASGKFIQSNAFR